jgi:hypothetical protein
MKRIIHALLLAAPIMAAAVSSAAAACVEDLVKADQDFAKTRSALLKAANAAPPVKCAAYRQHIASLTKVRNVFARCDTSAAKGKNAAKTNSEIASLNTQMRETCPAPAAAPKKS